MPSRPAVLATAAAATAAGFAAARHPVFGAAPAGARLARMRASPQWRETRLGGRFAHPEPSGVMPSAGTLWEFATADRSLRRPTDTVPVVRRTAADFDGAPDGLRATWLGHATTLVEIEGLRLLIDPVLSRHASPLPLPMSARFFEAPLAAADLPTLDAVLVTHDHYDHLDLATVRALAPSVPRWIAPLGVGAHLERWGVPADRLTELDWWDETAVGGVRVVATPARHFSGRGLLDRDRTLWCGYGLVGAAHRLYATGDGGMQRAFAEIGERLGPFDASLVEIGAYNAAWADVHLGPEQAVAAHVAARGGLLIPVHWGTFDLAMHGWTEPVERLLVAAEAAGVAVAVPRPGERVDPSSVTPPERWWPALPWQTADQTPVVSSGFEAVGRA